MLEFLKEYNENNIYEKAMDCERGLLLHDSITPMAAFFERVLKVAYLSYWPGESEYDVEHTDFSNMLKNRLFISMVQRDYNLSERDIKTIDTKIRPIRNHLIHRVSTEELQPDTVKECFKCVYKFAAGYYCKVSHQMAPEWSDAKYQELLNSAHSEAEHKERIAECESTISKLKDDLGDSKKKVSDAQEEIFKLNLQLEEATQNNADAQEFEALKSRIDKLENAINDKLEQAVVGEQHVSGESQEVYKANTNLEDNRGVLPNECHPDVSKVVTESEKTSSTDHPLNCKKSVPKRKTIKSLPIFAAVVAVSILVIAGSKNSSGENKTNQSSDLSAQIAFEDGNKNICPIISLNSVKEYYGKGVVAVEFDVNYIGSNRYFVYLDPEEDPEFCVVIPSKYISKSAAKSMYLNKRIRVSGEIALYEYKSSGKELYEIKLSDLSSIEIVK